MITPRCPDHLITLSNEADWIFRNDILRRRETALYVDYEETQRGEFEWNGRDRDLLSVAERLTKLVLALRTSGVLTEAGARAAAKVWKNVLFSGSSRWEIARDRAKHVLLEVATQKQEKPSTATEGCLAYRDEQMDVFVDTNWIST